MAWEDLPVIGYRVAKVERTDLGFSLKGLNHEFVAPQIRNKVINGSDASRDSIFGYATIDMPTAEVRYFFENNVARVFDEASL